MSRKSCTESNPDAKESLIWKANPDGNQRIFHIFTLLICYFFLLLLFDFYCENSHFYFIQVRIAIVGKYIGCSEGSLNNLFLDEQYFCS